MFCRDLHSNLFTGTVPSLLPLTKLAIVNLASNFFFGDVPSVNPNVNSDFRFNYFSRCDGTDICCELSSACAFQCSPVQPREKDEISPSLPLPDGVEKSAWVEMNVDLLGTNKRVIQIETVFSSSPHILTSHACPKISSLDSCNSSSVSRSSFASDNISGTIHLEAAVPVFNSQNPNTNHRFDYVIQGDICATSVKVSHDHIYSLSPITTIFFRY
jgi:hypothetical protein